MQVEDPLLGLVDRQEDRQGRVCHLVRQVWVRLRRRGEWSLLLGLRVPHSHLDHKASLVRQCLE